MFEISSRDTRFEAPAVVVPLQWNLDQPNLRRVLRWCFNFQFNRSTRSICVSDSSSSELPGRIGSWVPLKLPNSSWVSTCVAQLWQKRSMQPTRRVCTSITDLLQHIHRDRRVAHLAPILSPWTWNSHAISDWGMRIALNLAAAQQSKQRQGEGIACRFQRNVIHDNYIQLYTCNYKWSIEQWWNINQNCTGTSTHSRAAYGVYEDIRKFAKLDSHPQPKLIHRMELPWTARIQSKGEIGTRHVSD